jgi:hypothetical protein
MHWTLTGTDRSLTEGIGFGHSDRGAARRRPRVTAMELIASTALAVSTMFVATVLTFGVAHAATITGSVGTGRGTTHVVIAVALVVVLSLYVALNWRAGAAAD